MRARALVLCVDWLVVITITTIVTIMVVVVAAAATVSLFSYLRLMPKDYNWYVYCLLTYLLSSACSDPRIQATRDTLHAYYDYLYHDCFVLFRFEAFQMMFCLALLKKQGLVVPSIFFLICSTGWICPMCPFIERRQIFVCFFFYHNPRVNRLFVDQTFAILISLLRYGSYFFRIIVN